LILCRHGDSIWNGGEPGCRETFTGWTDVSLSQKGIREAKRTGEQLQQKLVQYQKQQQHSQHLQHQLIDVCCTSLLCRAQMTAHYCLWEGLFALDSPLYQHQRPLYVTDYRLNERHYGRLQGYVKEDVEKGRQLNYKSAQVKEWRRSWYAVPPLLTDDDPRRQDEIRRFQNACDGPSNIPRGESLDMVAKNRIQPFLHELLTPLLRQTAQAKGGTCGGTALIVGHANSLRALIGVICNVTSNPTALAKLEALRIPTAVPLAVQYQETNVPGQYQVCTSVPRASNDLQSAWSTDTSDLPVWPLSSVSLGKAVKDYVRFIPRGEVADNKQPSTPAAEKIDNRAQQSEAKLAITGVHRLLSAATKADIGTNTNVRKSNVTVVDPFFNTTGPMLAIITEIDACDTPNRVEETLAVLETILQGNEEEFVQLISVRVSPSSSRELVVDLISSLVKMAATHKSCTKIVVSSDWLEAALEGKAHGLHVKESHRNRIPSIRQRFQDAGLPVPLIGTSAHSIASALDAIQTHQPNYMFVGTCYPTMTHPEKKAEQLEGPKLPGRVARALQVRLPGVSCPIFAIGGIDASNCYAPVQMGAVGVATIRAVLQAENPVATVRAMRQAMVEAVVETEESTC